MTRLITLFILISCVTTVSAQELTLVVSPALSPDGSQIAFSYQGDIWTVPLSGGISRRLTIHESYESGPQWSPDGSEIAFQGSRWGNNDIYVMTADGGRPNRLSFHSTGDTGPKWLADGSIIFSSRRGFAQVERESEVHMVSREGGTPQRILDATVLSPVSTPDGRTLIFVRGNCRIAREAYTGPANRNIWKYDMESESFTQMTFHDGQDINPDIAGGSIYFLSARSGRYNIYSMPLNGKEDSAQALTNFTDEGITHFDISDDGSTIVFTRSEGLFLMRTSDPSEISQIEIKVAADDRFDPIEHKTFSKDAADYAMTSDEKYMVLEIRGELFIKPHDKEKKRAVQLTDNPYRDKNAVLVNDSTIVFSSDREGNFNLYSMSSTDSESNLYKSFEIETKRLTNHPDEEEELMISPDKSKIAFRRGRGQLIVVDVDITGQLSNERVLLDGWDTPRGVAWSPDSKWLAYALSDLNFNREIYIHAADGSQEPVNISLHPRSDSDPVWSQDGSKLAFISNRNNSDDDLWFVWLKKSDWEKTKRDWEEDDEEDDGDGDEKSKAGKKDKAVKPVQIDFENIYQRLEQVTRLAGNEDNLTISNDGEIFYFTTNGGSRQGSPDDPDLMEVSWDGSELKTIISEINIRETSMNDAGKKILAIKRGGTIVSIDPSSKKQETLGFTAKMDINHAEERMQVFDEGWRRLRDGFYDPEYHGENWDELRERYRLRSVAASTDQDFRLYYNQMLGQLNSSHMGMYGPSRDETQDENTGLLGIDITPIATGIQVKHVISSTPASREESRLNIGDVITAVNGESVSATSNFYKQMMGTTSERTLLHVTAPNGLKREVIIRPTNSIRTENYDAWFNERKKLTDTYSNGRLGYIHIRGMNWSSFERFERELAASGHQKEGIVIDVRFNGGGWTTDMLMSVLNVRQHAFTIPRGAVKSLEKEKNAYRETYPFGERVPLSSWTKPSIALCNENSYSNAEIFAHAYQSLGHGTLVGRPTFGAVISTGSASLINGSRVRMPFRAWYVKSTNKNMEHGPAVPDIEVYNRPDSKAKGEDPQLRRAVSELLSQIDAKQK